MIRLFDSVHKIEVSSTQKMEKIIILYFWVEQVKL